MAEQFLRYNEVAKRFGVSRVTIWRWIQNNRFPAPVRLGGNIVAFRASEVEAFAQLHC